MTTLTARALVREATIEDLPACLASLRALQQATHWRQYPDFSVVDGTAWLITRGCLFVADDDAQVIGMIGGSMGTHPLFQAVPYAQEEVFYVDPPARGGHAGRALLHAFRAWARAQQAEAVVLGRPSHHGECTRWHPLGGVHA